MPNYFSSSPTAHEVAWPKTVYSKDKDPKTVNSQAELDALNAEAKAEAEKAKADAKPDGGKPKGDGKEEPEGDAWSLEYIKRDYPKAKYKAKTAEEVKNLKPGEAWYDAIVVATPEDEGKVEGGYGDKLPPDPRAEQKPAPKESPMPPAHPEGPPKAEHHGAKAENDVKKK